MRNPIDYSASGDDVDTAAQKVKAEFEIVYQLLNRLRKLDASIGADVSDPTAYQLHINSSTGKLYIRNGQNTAWIELGDITSEYFGITAGKIGAIGKSEKMGKMYAGDANDTFPTEGVETHDLYFDYAKKIVYFYDGVAWQKLLSLNFGDIIDYEQYCVAKSEVDYNGAGKILRLDSVTGRANVDISGSPLRLLGYLIETANLQDDQVLVYDSEKQKWVNKPRNTNTDYTINGIPVVELTNRIQHGDVLVYCSRIQKFIPKPKDYVQEIDITETGEIHKLTRVSSDGLLHVNIAGYASGLNGKLTAAGNATDGDILVYRDSAGKFICEPKGNTLGEGRSLRIYDGTNLLGEYNGSQLTNIDIARELKKLILKNGETILGEYNGSSEQQIDLSSFGDVTNESIMKLQWQLVEMFEGSNIKIGDKVTDAISVDFHGDLSLIEPETQGIFQGYHNLENSILISKSTLDGICVGNKYFLSDGNNAHEVTVSRIRFGDVIFGDVYLVSFENGNVGSFENGKAWLSRVVSDFKTSDDLTEEKVGIGLPENGITITGIDTMSNSVRVDDVTGLTVGKYYRIVKGTDSSFCRLNNISNVSSIVAGAYGLQFEGLSLLGGNQPWQINEIKFVESPKVVAIHLQQRGFMTNEYPKISIGDQFMVTDGENYKILTLQAIQQLNFSGGSLLIQFKEGVNLGDYANYDQSRMKIVPILSSSSKSIGDKKFITKPINVDNAITGMNITVVHTENQSVKVYLSTSDQLQHAIEVAGIGTGSEQEYTVQNATGFTNEGLKLSFDGVEQSLTSGYIKDTQTGTLKYTAPSGAIVTVEYNYNSTSGAFEELQLTQVASYKNPNKAGQIIEQFTASKEIASCKRVMFKAEVAGDGKIEEMAVFFNE